MGYIHDTSATYDRHTEIQSLRVPYIADNNGVDYDWENTPRCEAGRNCAFFHPGMTA